MQTKNLVKSLQHYGIRAAAYRRPPVGQDVFALTILPNHPEGTITVNQGNTRVEVFGDKSHRQAAVTVVEQGRKVTRRVTGSSTSGIAPSHLEMFSDLKGNFPIIMPADSTWIYKDLKVRKAIPDKNYLGYPIEDRLGRVKWRFSATVTAKVVSITTNHFLMGMDETHHFIAPLPAQAKSVSKAHSMLRPKKLRGGTVRQGEWFFEPCLNSMTKKLDQIVNDNPRCLKVLRLAKTTHTAKTAVIIKRRIVRRRSSGGYAPLKATIYARGYIIDSRSGHHKPTHLAGWHKVIKNKEAVIKVSPAQQQAAARRRQTWD